MRLLIENIKESLLSHPDVRESAAYPLARSHNDHPLTLDRDQEDFEDDEWIGNDDGISRGCESVERPRTVWREKRMGRNEPCPCGSGKKFQECCYRP